jgi:hypothetical protein
MPKGCGYVYRLTRELRHQLEAEIVHKHGQVGIFHAALVQTACRHEGRAQLLSRWLKQHADEMGHHDRLSYLREIGNASDARDRALKTLGLDADGRENVLDALYSSPAPDTDEKAPGSPSNRGSDPATTKHTWPDATPTDAPVCDLCDGKGFSGRACPSCGKESDD